MKDFGFIGHPVTRVDGREKATGDARFLRDVKVPDMLYGKILRSPYPHAKIVSINTRKAKALLGVRAVITADDTPQIKFSYVPHLADKLPLAKGKVRFPGDEVAAICALDEETAEEALGLIEVVYEELPAVFDPEEALAPDAPAIHDGETNVAMTVFRDFGNVDEGFALSDHVFEDRYTTHRVTHCCLETRGCIASFSRSGKLTMWSTTQTPYALKNELSRILGIPSSHIRVLKTHMGGGFGGRLVMDMIEPIAALLSKWAGRPVAIFNTRKEEFNYSSVRYPFIVELKTGVKQDGTIVARKAKVIIDNGAYNERGPATLSNAAMSFVYLYRTPNVRFEGSLVYTNNLHGAAFRGFGNPQITYAIECQMDTIAEKIGMDPAQLRMKNIHKSGERTASGALIPVSGLAECIEEATRAAGWEDRASRRKDEHVGMGIAVMIHSGGGVRVYKYNAADAFIIVRDDGRAHVLTGVSEQGQGATTVLAQIVSEETGIPMSDVCIADTDTDANPMDLGAYASRTTYVLGNAVRAAARDVRQQLLASAAEALEADPLDLGISDGRIFVREMPQTGLPVKEVMRLRYAKGLPLSGMGRFVDPIPPDMDPASGVGDISPCYCFSCVVAKVRVDTKTGEVTVLELVSANDLGRVINPLGAEGQVQGALLQGLGFTFLEELILDKGVAVNGNFLDYKIPTALDICPFKIIMVESDEPTGPYGAKGIGEAAIVPVAPAIANAIRDAVGIRLNNLPLRKEVIYEHLSRQCIGGPLSSKNVVI